MKRPALPIFRWSAACAALGVLAWALGLPSAAPSSPSASGSGSGGFAGAASSAGFKPLAPGQAVVDLGAFTPLNVLPDGVPYEGFRVLSGFAYESDFETWNDPFSEPKRRKHPKRFVPEAIRGLDGRRVACMGFMLPFDFKAEGTRHFGLMRNQVGCCFGMAPGLNEWIDVTVLPGDSPVEVAMDQPLLVVGVLHVKPIVEAGNTMGLYRLTLEKIEKAKIAK
jgi:hypothetical protein